MISRHSTMALFAVGAVLLSGIAFGQAGKRAAASSPATLKPGPSIGRFLARKAASAPSAPSTLSTPSTSSTAPPPRPSLAQKAGQLLGLAAGGAKPAPHKEELAEPTRPGEPPLKKMPDGDPARDAAGRGQLFESIIVPGVTGLQEGMNGVALVDLNKDGWMDIVAAYSAPRGSGGAGGSGEKLRAFLNQGNFQFKAWPIKILDSKVAPESFGRGQVPVLADFNGDGFLDLFVTRNAAMSSGESNRRGNSVGNSLLVSAGSWDTFRDVSAPMGIQNEDAYNRQPSIGDVNGDGWLDVAVGCDNIKNAMGGFPHSRLYVFQSKGAKFEDGTFQDIGGSTSLTTGGSTRLTASGADLVPDFGGFYHDSNRDKAGPDINLRDLDNDGDLDLIQSYHVDCAAPDLPYCPGEYRQGVFCWKNLLKETGQFRFENVTDNGLACVGRLKYDKAKQLYEPVEVGPGLPYVSLADVDNDGLLDVLAVGPDSPYWAPRAEDVSGRFWHNLGSFKFQEATAKSGLDAINWNYGGWLKFFDCPVPNLGRTRALGQPSVAQPGVIMSADPTVNRPYYSDAVFGDFNNDGWQDVVVLDRHEMVALQTRAMLFMNRGSAGLTAGGDGTFEPEPTTFSGLDSSGIAAEAADLNNDGLLDLIIAADPDNSGVARNMERYESKVYWNTGEHGARMNHWLRLRFSGVKDSELIGARVEAQEPGSGRLLGLRVIFPQDSYKSGCPMEAHFGLGTQDRVDIMVALLDGKTAAFSNVKADQFCDLNLDSHAIKPVAAGS
ncbi:MAG: CRTAC1 family protein [Candidatus Sumerlaeota bacterium]|nr:CRTAC1 family protein [Candidatus Sumerlaeota bacterium]